jgi:hypothetical protein
MIGSYNGHGTSGGPGGHMLLLLHASSVKETYVGQSSQPEVSGFMHSGKARA